LTVSRGLTYGACGALTWTWTLSACGACDALNDALSVALSWCLMLALALILISHVFLTLTLILRKTQTLILIQIQIEILILGLKLREIRALMSIQLRL
jgi:hypothetical protein